MLRAAGAAADAVDVLVALRGVLGEVDACGWKEGWAREKKEEGTNWFSMAIFGINYPTRRIIYGWGPDKKGSDML